jgi:hypothetical protein
MRSCRHEVSTSTTRRARQPQSGISHVTDSELLRADRHIGWRRDDGAPAGQSDTLLVETRVWYQPAMYRALGRHRATYPSTGGTKPWRTHGREAPLVRGDGAIGPQAPLCSLSRSWVYGSAAEPNFGRKCYHKARQLYAQALTQWRVALGLLLYTVGCLYNMLQRPVFHARDEGAPCYGLARCAISATHHG